MYEIIPLFLGVVIGLGLSRLGPLDRTLRIITVGILAIVIGFIAASVSGEIEESWMFVLFDAAQVVVAAVLTVWLAGRLGWSRTTARG